VGKPRTGISKGHRLRSQPTRPSSGRVACAAGSAAPGRNHLRGVGGAGLSTSKLAGVTLFDTPEREAGPAKVKLVVAYDGTDFSGFAAQPGQPGVRTVGGVLDH